MARLMSGLAALRSLGDRGRLVVRLLRDRRVSGYVKSLALVPLIYVVWPVDVVPDLVPLLGQLDDVGVLLLAVEGLLSLCPRDVVEHHRCAIERGRRWSPAPASGEVIEAEWRRDDPE
jgi:uncharacterized membrane protein YkvA (DUF1232 family)